MTKLMQWLCFAAAFLAVWIGLLTESFPIKPSPQTQEVIQVLPLYLLMVFACYSLATIGYRVAMFNDCVDASEELKKEVVTARKDLTSKGFIFDN